MSDRQDPAETGTEKGAPPPPVRAYRHRRGRRLLHVGAALVLGSYTATCVYGALEDALGLGSSVSAVLCPLLCVLQPVGIGLMILGSRMAPTSAARDGPEKA